MRVNELSKVGQSISLSFYRPLKYSYYISLCFFYLLISVSISIAVSVLFFIYSLKRRVDHFVLVDSNILLRTSFVRNAPFVTTYVGMLFVVFCRKEAFVTPLIIPSPA